MPEPTIEFIGKRLDAIQTELREIKFAADVDRSERHSSQRALVTELGTALGTFETRIDHRLAAMEHRIGSIDERLPAMEHRIGSIDERLPAMEHRIGSIDERLPAIEHRIDSVDERLTTMGQQLARIEALLKK